MGLSLFPPLMLLLTVTANEVMVPLSLNSRGALLRAESEYLMNYQNVPSIQTQYSGILTLGIPPQKLNFLFDTTSAVTPMQWVWAQSTECTTCYGGSAFCEDCSSTYQALGKFESIDFGSGQCYGELSTDVLALRGNATVSQTFILVDDESDLVNLNADGVVVRTTQGLAFDTLSKHHPTFLDNLHSVGLITSRSFAIHLSSINDTHSKGSYLVFGATELPSGSHSIPIGVTDSGLWSVPITNFAVGSNNITLQNQELAVIDTTKNLIQVPEQHYHAVIEQLMLDETKCGKLQGLTACVCDSTSDFPKLVLSLGGENFEVPSENYISRAWIGDAFFCVFHISESSLVLSSLAVWTLGSPFLIAHELLFNMDTMTLHIETDHSSSSTLPIWAIALISAGCFLCLLSAIGVLVICCIRRKRRPGVQSNIYVMAPMPQPISMPPASQPPAYPSIPVGYPVPSAPPSANYYPQLD